MKLEAIKNVYPSACSVTDYGTHVEVRDAQGNPVTIDESAVAAEIQRLQPIKAAEQADAKRKAAYIAEADPLFFKAQRGEATMEEWQAKVQEIKARFPK